MMAGSGQRGRSACGLALVMCVVASCKPSGQREGDAVAPPQSAPVDPASFDEDSSAREVDAVTGETSSTPGPHPQDAVSKMPERLRIVSAAAQPGLVTFANEMPGEGLLWVGQLDGNGGRDVLIHVPPGADDRADFRLVYHFHGTYSETFEKQRPGMAKKEWVGWNRLDQTLAAAAQLQTEHDYNVALVYPFSAGKRREPGATGWWNGAYDRMWMAPTEHPEHRDSFDRLHEEVVTILGERFGVHSAKLAHPVVAEGHSAGGIALRNIAAAGTRLVGEYIFQDASFQTWADGCFDAVRSGKSSGRITLVITTKGIADPISGRDPWCTRLEGESTAWKKHAGWCATRKERSPPGSEVSCTDLEEGAEAWLEFASWCDGMKNDMVDVPEVLVHRTKIPHGKQPRHFTGGLELPSSWHQGREPSTR
jgi:hypothetical protein